jgi:predicted nuclease of predicted toxin-antitoxin system
LNPNAKDSMRFLADVNIEKAVVDHLRQNNYDIKWTPDYDRQMSDEGLLDMAAREKRILVTNDKDFGELVFRQRRSLEGVIVLRVKGQQIQDKMRILGSLLKNHQDKIAGSLVVLSKDKIRIIPMENRP